MSAVHRTATVVASGALALTVGLAGAPAALADRVGDDPPEQLGAELMARPYPTYSQGDRGYIVRAIQHMLIPTVDYDPGDGVFGVYTPHVTDAVRAWQEENNGVPEHAEGKVETETWNMFRDWYGEVGRHSSGHKVSAAQSMLVERGYLDPDDIDGIFGGVTEDAVISFQEDTCTEGGEECLVGDGWVGPLTFRALVTGGI
ncbi:MAG: peptidoglycan-binding protein [Nocardiopsaceae bacterium]|nr:peptidoglycan-binding protein [Nocardiopsaceae bacterium]